MEKIKELKEFIAIAEAEADKFYNKDNGAAGTRLRKALQQIKTTAQLLRNEVSEKKNAK